MLDTCFGRSFPSTFFHPQEATSDLKKNAFKEAAKEQPPARKKPKKENEKEKCKDRKARVKNEPCSEASDGSQASAPSEDEQGSDGLTTPRPARKGLKQESGGSSDSDLFRNQFERKANDTKREDAPRDRWDGLPPTVRGKLADFEQEVLETIPENLSTCLVSLSTETVGVATNMSVAH